MKIQNIKVRILRIQRPIDILYIDIYYLSRMISKNDTSIYLNKKVFAIIHVYQKVTKFSSSRPTKIRCSLFEISQVKWPTYS